MGGIEPLIVLPVAALHLAVMPRCIRTNELVLDTKIISSFLKKGLDVPFTVGKTVGKFKTVASQAHSSKTLRQLQGRNGGSETLECGGAGENV